MITGGTNQQLIGGARASVERSRLDDPLRARQRDRERRAIARALTQEQRRIAADIHDLIMQDLAFALGTARALADDATNAPLADTVVAAGERALAGARHVLDALSGGQRELVVEAVEASMRTAARHVPLRFEADEVPTDARPDERTFHALVHIAREAVTNAIKHADPFLIEAVFAHEDEWRLRVSDDGRGFDPSDACAGFGLQSMGWQAHALGGSLRVHSAPGAGTTIEAILP